MSAEILSMHGSVPTGEPNCALVTALEKLLAQAKRGEISSLAWAGYTNQADDTQIAAWYVAGGPETYAIHSAIRLLDDAFTREILEVRHG